MKSVADEGENLMSIEEELRALKEQLKHDEHGLKEGDGQLWADVLDSKLDFLCNMIILQLKLSTPRSMSLMGRERIQKIINTHREKTQAAINHALKQYIDRRDHGKK